MVEEICRIRGGEPGGSFSSNSSAASTMPSSRRCTSDRVVSIGVPWGMVRAATTLSASIWGRKVNLIKPPATMPKIRQRMATAIAMTMIGTPRTIVRQLFIASPLNLRLSHVNVTGDELFQISSGGSAAPGAQPFSTNSVWVG